MARSKLGDILGASFWVGMVLALVGVMTAVLVHGCHEDRDNQNQCQSMCNTSGLMDATALTCHAVDTPTTFIAKCGYEQVKDASVPDAFTYKLKVQEKKD